jgi:hypothetical protein
MISWRNIEKNLINQLTDVKELLIFFGVVALFMSVLSD